MPGRRDKPHVTQDRDKRRRVVAAVPWGVSGLVAALVGAATAAGWIDWPVAGVWLTRHTVGLIWVALVVVLIGGAIWRVLPRHVADLLVNWARRGASLLPRWARRRANGAIASAARPPLSWWMVAVAVTVVALVAWGATSWLLQVASTAKDPAAAQVEAIKTGLSIAAGTGGVFALLLAVRRQWHQEVSTAADATYKEQVAADTKADASARRITELYTKAADQLGSDKASVRLAGLYALERLAQDNEDQRPTIVQVLCAYLRMPYTPPKDVPEPDATSEQRQDHRDLVQEREVRLTAQRILVTHLCPGSDPDHPDSTFWPNTSLDLTGATLIDLDLSNCHLHIARFANAQFTGHAGFGGVRFAEDAEFGGAVFTEDAWFSGTKFTGTAKFGGTRFGGNAQFGEAEFARDARFGGAVFGGTARFGMARFGRNAEFVEAEFAGTAEFGMARFGGTAGFGMARFGGDASFGLAQFTGDVTRFVQTQFAQNVEFVAAEFTGTAEFGGTRFGRDAWFGEAQFARDAHFLGARFGGDSGFAGARFGGDARFGEAQFTGGTWFVGAQLVGNAEFGKAQFDGETWFVGVRFGGNARFVGVRFGGNARFIEMQFARDARFSGTQFAEHAGFGGTQFAGRAWFDGVKFAVGVGFKHIAPDEEPLDESGQCWVRVDVPDMVARARVWPAGWMVQALDGHRPPGQHEGQWGQLMRTPPDPNTGTDESLLDTEDDLATGRTPALPEPAAEALE
ncbi:hypothetical protein KUTG_05593 [Kutzneria sp. 744]|nr:hypothetical protein KUTG_05593 [Kutzneria sp. 744]